jgi:hypothetical protein
LQHLLLNPTPFEPPATLEDLTPPQDREWKLVSKIGQHLFFTSPFNVTGQPAISLPLHGTPEGLFLAIKGSCRPPITIPRKVESSARQRSVTNHTLTLLLYEEFE